MTFFLSLSPWNPIPHLLESQQQFPSAASSVEPSIYVPKLCLSSLRSSTFFHSITLPFAFSQSGSCGSSAKQRLCLAYLFTTLPYIYALLSQSSLSNSSNNSCLLLFRCANKQSTPDLTTRTQAYSAASSNPSRRLCRMHLYPCFSNKCCAL